MARLHTQMIDQDGNYKVEDVTNFMTDTNLSECGKSYSVVAILGPQHGGKSTIMNCLFGTQFKQMDTFGRRMQTTRGIWIAKCAGSDGHPIIAMDMEGTDGRERGEDDTAFEKRSSLLALAIADVVLINVWCTDLGREHAANKPLLKVVFEALVRMSSESGPRKVTLLFVLRDKTLTPFEHLKADVEEETLQIWNTVAERHRDGMHGFSEYFHIEVVALSSFEREMEVFVQEVGAMKQRYFGSNLSHEYGDRPDRVPTSAFAYSTGKIWDEIMQNKDLDIPAHRVMVETFRCEKIATKMFDLLSFDEEWSKLRKNAEGGPVSGYSKTFLSILETYLMQYDNETKYYEEGIRNTKRQELHSRAVRELGYPTFLRLVGNFSSNALESFKTMSEESLKPRKQGIDDNIQACCMRQFESDCNDAKIEMYEWDTSAAREKLLSDMNAQLTQLRDSKLSELVAAAKGKVVRGLLGAMESIMEDAGDDIWASIRERLENERSLALNDFNADIVYLKLEEATINSTVEYLRDYSRGVAEKEVREEAKNVEVRMENRFSRDFTPNDDGIWSVFTGERDVEKRRLEALKASLKRLSAMAVMRFDDNKDTIHDQLFSAFIDPEGPELSSSRWEEVSSDNTLITPMKCKSIWKNFVGRTRNKVDQALKKVAEYRRKLLVAVGTTVGVTLAVVGTIATGGITGIGVVGVIGIAEAIAGALAAGGFAVGGGGLLVASRVAAGRKFKAGGDPKFVEAVEAVEAAVAAAVASAGSVDASAGSIEAIAAVFGAAVASDEVKKAVAAAVAAASGSVGSVEAVAAAVARALRSEAFKLLDEDDHDLAELIQQMVDQVKSGGNGFSCSV